MNFQEIAKRAEKAEVYPNPIFPPSPYYRFFELLAQEMKPNLSVVLGVCGGGDCLHLCKGNPDGMVVGVDIAWDHPEQLKHIIDNYPNFRFQLCSALDAAQMIFDIYGPIDILFIDSIHEFKNTFVEFDKYKPYLSDRAVVCFDDLHRNTMKGVWEGLPEPKTRIDDMHPGSTEGGFGVVYDIRK